MDKLFVGERVAIGKDWESKITNCLINHYGYNLVDSTFHEDCREKTDRWLVSKTGKQHRCAIKVRLDKNGNLDQKRTDILIALRDPFYGVENEKTVIGRDVLYEYAMYISLAHDNIRVADGKIIHSLTNVLWEEYVDNFGEFVPNSSGFGAKLMLSSEQAKGCQIWLHYDGRSRHPKLLAFIPPDILKTPSQIKYHKYIEDQNG